MKIIWSSFAIKNIEDIYNHYLKIASRHLALLITNSIYESVKQLLKNPESAQIETLLKELKQKHRRLITGNYKVIYRIEVNTIIIVDIIDSRRHPDKNQWRAKNLKPITEI
jgi:plasmid stabilization system protein ParE